MQTSIVNREPRPCILVRLACEKCGPVRMALAPQAEPITSFECPYCFSEATAEEIGTGQTMRELPYFEYEHLFARALQQPFTGPARRIESGQLVLYCPETDILHVAVVGNVHTSRLHLSPGGPSISFVIHAEETDPVRHLSGCEGVPPFWCCPDELPRGAEPKPPRHATNRKKTGSKKTRNRKKPIRARKKPTFPLDVQA